MKTAWVKAAARFNALQTRERVLVLLATLAIAIALFYQLAIGVAQTRKAAALLRLSQAQNELVRVDGQIGLLTTELQDPDAGLRSTLADTRARIQQADARLAEFERSLVPPNSVPAVLQQLLARRSGLALTALRSLPPQPLAEHEAAPGDSKTKDSSQKEAEFAVFRHGVEITLQGRYSDLLGYVAELEAVSPKLYWAGLSLRVQAYPVSQLKVTVYTLSLDRIWLRV